MKIQTKLVITAFLAVSLSAVAISFTSLQFTQTNELKRVDRELLKVTAVEDKTSEDNIAPAIKAAEVARIRVILNVISSDGFQVQLDDRKLVDITRVSLVTIKAAAVEPISITVDSKLYRLSTVKLGGGSYLTALSSLQYLEDTYEENLRTFIWISIISILVGGALIGYIVRRDLVEIEKVVEYSESVSRGDLDAEFKGRNRSPEIIQLTDSLKRMVTSLTESIKKERELQTSMKDFLGDASHELKTPLTVIKGYNELLVSQRSKMTAESINSAHENISIQIERMDMLVKDLLLLTEIETSEDITTQRLDFSELLNWSVDEFVDRNPQRSVEIEIQVNQWVNGSEILLSRLVLNILRNIEVHTPSNAAVRLQLSGEAGQAVLKIGDAGPGLPSESYVQGIQSFRRFDASRSRDTGGSGLGMSIISSIVERYRGEISLSPSPLGGLEIEIKLPLSV
jgi:signal transduction histidine kinase